MADTKISALSAASLAAMANEIPINEAGTTKKITLTQVSTLLAPFSIVPSGNFGLSAASGVQSAFPTTGDVWTFAANTAYFFEGFYDISTGSTTTKTIALAFAAAGGGSITSCKYFAIGQKVAINTTGTTQSSCAVDTNASTVILPTGTETRSWIHFKGILRMNAAGTITPQINFSANPGGTNTMNVNSYIRFTPIGSDTTNIAGPVG